MKADSKHPAGSEHPADKQHPGEEYLLTKAAEQGFVTHEDILAAFPQAQEHMEEL
jgi:hypothetical protein